MRWDHCREHVLHALGGDRESIRISFQRFMLARIAALSRVLLRVGGDTMRCRVRSAPRPA
jgi:hypothetical protein